MKKLTITAVKMLLVSIVVTGVALFISACSNEDLITPSTEGVFDGKDAYWVEGTVSETSGPYEGAKVEVYYLGESERTQYTDEDGHYLHGERMAEFAGEDIMIKASLRSGEYQDKWIRDFQPGGYEINFYFP